ncbi:MAG: hypothetical protein AAGJ34_01700 [Pseudomonadota bacterium]
MTEKNKKVPIRLSVSHETAAYMAWVGKHEYGLSKLTDIAGHLIQLQVTQLLSRHQIALPNLDELYESYEPPAEQKD